MQHGLFFYLNRIIYCFFSCIVSKESGEEEEGEEEPEAPVQKKPVKKVTDKWSHDFFDASQQAPKSRAELVDSYGYDIRSEDGPPKARRTRRYKWVPFLMRKNYGYHSKD